MELYLSKLNDTCATTSPKDIRLTLVFLGSRFNSRDKDTTKRLTLVKFPRPTEREESRRKIKSALKFSGTASGSTVYVGENRNKTRDLCY